MIASTEAYDIASPPIGPTLGNMTEGEKIPKGIGKEPQRSPLGLGVGNGSLSDPRASSRSLHRCDGIACVIYKQASSTG